MLTGEQTKEEIIVEQILQAAKQLFQVHGFRKVTMDDVAKVIGKGRSSLYYYYKSKEEILDAVMDVEIDEMLGAMAKEIDKAINTEGKLYAFFATKLRVLRERRGFYSMMDAGMDADEMSNLNKAKHTLHRRIMKKESLLLHQILDKGIEIGELGTMNEKEKEGVVFVFLTAVRGLKQEMVIENDFSGIDEATGALTRMVIHGLKK